MGSSVSASCKHRHRKGYPGTDRVHPLHEPLPSLFIVFRRRATEHPVVKVSQFHGGLLIIAISVLRDPAAVRAGDGTGLASRTQVEHLTYVVARDQSISDARRVGTACVGPC